MTPTNDDPTGGRVPPDAAGADEAFSRAGAQPWAADAWYADDAWPQGYDGALGDAGGLTDLSEHVSLCEVLDRVLNKGVVVRGDVILSVAGIDLVYLGLDVLLCAAERAYELGCLQRRSDAASGDWL